jgi:hypothetical protein
VLSTHAFQRPFTATFEAGREGRAATM